jgi:hypothetical protein
LLEATPNVETSKLQLDLMEWIPKGQLETDFRVTIPENIRNSIIAVDNSTLNAMIAQTWRFSKLMNY